jgi:hypothetical protein
MSIESAKIYTRCSIYEPFINRTLGWSQNRKGGHMSVLVNLVNAETGNQTYGLPSYEKQLEDAKKYIAKAFDALLKKRLKQEYRNDIQELRNMIDRIYCSEDLINLIETGLAIMNKTGVA